MRISDCKRLKIPKQLEKIGVTNSQIQEEIIKIFKTNLSILKQKKKAKRNKGPLKDLLVACDMNK